MIPSIIWNCRGIGNLETQFYIASLIRQYRLGIVGLIEPMISSDRIQPLLKRLGMDHFHSKPTNHTWLFWTRPYSMELLVEGSQHITMTVRDLTQEFTFSVIYASHRSEERETLWADLAQYVRDYPTLVESPWYLAGDFNYVRNTSERQGGRIPRARNMETFNDCIFRLALIEPPTSGEVWTLRNLKLHLKWWNRHIYGNVHTQVDVLQKELAEVERLLQARYSDAAWERRSRVSDQLDEVVRRQ
ncbi:unnamed protein product [Spirodela intermedia]|uniref:Endonuclease/exonuclease/phosphatase domain-containing protein n=1 Tax=Spirodela intermedia TaxID=51605 RepID=A0A7I8KIU6_SPIIN|nr:unnamed protein product [Spirodela intermedia]